MLDIKLIRERPDFVKAELAKRGVEPAEVDRLLEVDQKGGASFRPRSISNCAPIANGGHGKLASCRLSSARPNIAKIRAEEADEEKLAEGEAIDVGNPLLIWGTQLDLQRSRSRSWRSLSPNIPRRDVVARRDRG